MLHINTTWWVYEVNRCSNNLRARSLQDPTCVETETNQCEYNYDKDENGDYVDPECAEDKDIDEWIKDISVSSRLLNQQIDFGLDKHPIKEAVYWLPTLNLENMFFCDVGLAFRHNVLNARDSWVPGFGDSITHFYDIVFFNVDRLPAASHYRRLASIYFRIDGNERNHQRVVFGIKDWLASIAGIEKLLLKYIAIVFGGYINFNATIEIINQHYGKDRPAGQSGSGKHDKHHQLDISRWERIKCYASSKYRLYRFCCGSKKILHDISCIQAGSKDLSRDFNTKNILDLLQMVSEQAQQADINKQTISEIQEAQHMIKKKLGLPIEGSLNDSRLEFAINGENDAD